MVSNFRVGVGMKLTIDLESRSKINLPKCGMYRYAEDESTDIMCFAFKCDDSPAELWVPGKFLHLLGVEDPEVEFDLMTDEDVEYLIAQASVIECHNAGFEAVMWHEIMHKRYGFTDLPLDKLRCSAAKASSFALPRALGKACEVLGLSQQKDKVGYDIMMKMCKPNKQGNWEEKPEDFKKLCEYCKQDVEAEHALSKELYDLSDFEQKVWKVDQIINRRGVAVDLEAIEAVSEKVKSYEKSLLLECQQLTQGAIRSPRQVAASIKWLKDEHAIEVDNLQKGTVEELLGSGEVPKKVERFMQIRQAVSRASVAKFSSMQRYACKDGRVRGSMLYWGAERTGRWAGKGVQPHNMPRKCDINGPDNFKAFDHKFLMSIYGDVLRGASQSIRPTICAKPGSEFICRDYASIEGRILAWLACEINVLDAYNRGKDMYKVAAAPVFGKKYEEVNNDERQVGKVIELACGYQGFTGAFAAMAKNYGLDIPEDEAAKAIMAWRETRSRTVALWHGLQSAAFKAVKNDGVYSYGRIKFGKRGRYLHMRLPSGRLLSYFDPSITTVTDKWKRTKEVISFMGVDNRPGSPTQGKWTRLTTYGGKLCENAVQGMARDVLAEAIVRLVDAEEPVVMHVHDEVVVELPKRNITEKRIAGIELMMLQTPEWLEGCPLDVSGWVGKRYRKD